MTDRPERKHYWLMKTEPDVFSIDNLAKLGRSPWDGVRNYQALNHMQAMHVGDLVLFYHSSTDDRGVVGLARVAREAYPDHTQFDPKSKYFDKTAKKAAPRWFMVDVEFVEKFPRFVPLSELREDGALEGMWLLKRGMRLSVQPVDKAHFKHIVKLGGGKTKVR